MSDRTDELLDEIVRLMALSLRQGMESQNEAILTFAQAGLESTRIAELLGTTPATVRAARAAAAKKTPKKARTATAKAAA